MDGVASRYEALLMLGAQRLKGFERRLFMAEVTREVCGESPRQAERRFGWGRETVRKALHELQQGLRCLENFSARGRPRMEAQNPQLAADIRDIVEPRTQSDPELKSARQYTNISAAEVRQALLDEKHYALAEVPSERTMRDILNRMNYRLKRIQKGKPLKKSPATDAIFANVQAVRSQYADDSETLQISVDTKTKVGLGDYARGGKNPDHVRRSRDERLGS